MKIMQADSYWNVPPLDTPCQRYTDRRQNGRYPTRNFRMRDPDFTSIDKMRGLDFTSIDNPSMGLNTGIKDNWQEANEGQGLQFS